TESALTSMTKNVEAFNEQVAQNTKLRNEIKGVNDELGRTKAKVGELQRQLRAAAKAGGGGGEPDKDGKGPAVAKGVEPHALLLDISKGKPLWDRPRGE